MGIICGRARITLLWLLPLREGNQEKGNQIGCRWIHLEGVRERGADG
jgi:hypothetical protein